MRLLSYNIRFGGVGRVGALATVVKAAAADLVVLQEATRPEIVEQLAELTGMSAWASDPGRSVGFLSRVPIASYRWHRTPPSRRAFLEIAIANSPFRIFGVHLTAVHSNWTERLRALEVRALLATVKGRQRGFHVVLGDFNTLAPGAKLELARLPPRLRAVVVLTGRKIRWRTIQAMIDGAYVDAYRLRHPNEHGYTFFASDPHIRLDYAFVPAAFASQLVACDVFDASPAVREATDHLPLVVELDVPSVRP